MGSGRSRTGFSSSTTGAGGASSTAGGAGWAIATGVLYGLTLDTKLNSGFLPFALGAHALLSRGAGLGRELAAGKVRLPLALICMVVIGPPLFVALWP